MYLYPQRLQTQSDMLTENKRSCVDNLGSTFPTVFVRLHERSQLLQLPRYTFSTFLTTLYHCFEAQHTACAYIYSRLLAITQQTHFLLSAGSASVSFSDVVTSDQCSQPEFTVLCAGVCLKARTQQWRRETEILEYTHLNLPLLFQQLFCCNWGIMEHGCDWITVPSDLESTDQSQQWNVHDSIQHIYRLKVTWCLKSYLSKGAYVIYCCWTLIVSGKLRVSRWAWMMTAVFRVRPHRVCLYLYVEEEGGSDTIWKW